MKFPLRLSIIVLLPVVFAASVGHPQEKKLIAAPNIVPPATEEMQHPEFWISCIDGDPDRVIMTQDQIRELNMKNRPRSLKGKDINGDSFSFKSITNRRDYDGNHYSPEDPLLMRIVSGDSLRAGIERGCNYVGNGKIYDRRELPFSEEMRKEIIDAIDLESIPDIVYPRYGILTVNTLSRRVPSHIRAYNSRFDWWVDTAQKLPCETGMPVAILHESRDRDWYYVNTEIVFGWVPARNVAVGSLENVRKLAESKEFIVALAHKVPVYADKDYTTWVTGIYQGARLKLVNKTSQGYRVLVPFRQHNGSLKAIDGWIKPDADVSVGYQPYTQRNVIDTVFKLLNRPYGGGGVDHERDCTGAVRTVLKTFGIITTAIPTPQLYFSDHVYKFPENTPKDVKYRYLDTCEPGITLCGFTGHIVMYLGKVDGNYYVIHSTGYSYHDEAGTEIRVGRTSVTSTEIEGGGHIDRFTELSVFKP